MNDAPDHWQSLTPEKRMEIQKHARALVRGSVIEDAASRFMAMCLAEAIGESKRRADLCTPTDERVKELEALLREAREDLAVYVDADYPETSRAKYPDIQRRWRRDMELCSRIDAALRDRGAKARAALRDMRNRFD